MWLVGSKPIRSNVKIPTTSLIARFFHKWRHAPCIMTPSIIPSPSILKYLKMWVVDSPRDVQHRKVFQWIQGNTGNYASVSAGWLWIMRNFKTLIQFFLVILGKSFMPWAVWDEEFYRWDGSKSGQQERSLWSFYWWKKQANLCRLLCFTGENKGLKKKFKTSGQPQASASQLLDKVKTALVILVFNSHSYM